MKTSTDFDTWLAWRRTGTNKVSMPDNRYPTPGWKIQRRRAESRADGKCQMCGRKGRHVHHIDADRSHNELDNLILLCVECHHRVHMKMSRDPAYRAKCGEPITNAEVLWMRFGVKA